MRGHLGSMQIAQQTFSKIVLAEFSSSRVKGDMSEVNTCVEPAAHVRDDPVLHSLADRLRYFQNLERSGDSQRRLAVLGGIAPAERSEERRVGNWGVGTCRSRRSPDH